jgi:3-oxoacyl-[acyl-carrier-protein] synthase II
MNKRVVVTGMGGVTPVGVGVEEFWKGIRDGISGVRPVTLFDASDMASRIAAEVKDFDPTKWISPKEVRHTDRFTQFAIAAAEEALEQAKLNSSSIDKSRVGVLIGSGIGGLSTIEEKHIQLLESGPKRMTPFFIPMILLNMASAHVAMRFGYKGPSSAIVTACATGAHCTGDAMRLIQRGEADVMVTGGAEAAITPLAFAGFCAMKALSTRNDEPATACRPFDKTRDGFVMAEGAGVLVIESLEHAAKRGAQPLAEIIGYGSSSDAYHITAPSPGGEGAALAMNAALDDAGISPEEVDYYNAHGTGTQQNDSEETAAVKSVFGEHAYRMPVSSTKAVTGHLLGAAGAIELMVLVKALNENTVPPTMNYHEPDPKCDLDYTPNKARQQRVDVAVSASLGFGGHNAIMVLKKAE